MCVLCMLNKTPGLRKLFHLPKTRVNERTLNMRYSIFAFTIR